MSSAIFLIPLPYFFWLGRSKIQLTHRAFLRLSGLQNYYQFAKMVLVYARENQLQGIGWYYFFCFTTWILCFVNSKRNWVDIVITSGVLCCRSQMYWMNWNRKRGGGNLKPRQRTQSNDKVKSVWKFGMDPEQLGITTVWMKAKVLRGEKWGKLR